MLDASLPALPDTTCAEPIPQAARAEIERLLQSGDLFRYTAPADAPVTLLEREFAAALGAGYALAVSSCSAALFLALKALELPPGARVLVPAFTFAAVPSAIVHAGCTPVLVEVGDDFRIVLEDLEARLASGGAAAILVSHMRGHTSDMDAILALAARHDMAVIEDAAHSLGTLWKGRHIGTLGAMGCFSFQSYKMLNAGEGGMIITDDPSLAARAIVMSGAYEHNWAKHDADAALSVALAGWQNRLPLYNMRLGNLSAALVRAQLAELPARVAAGRANHDAVAARLRACPERFAVPEALPGEARAPDSLQFTLRGLSDAQARQFIEAARARGLPVQIFGLSTDNARAFWNWGFLGPVPDLPRTRAMLMRACDVRLPSRLTAAECQAIAEVLLDAAAEANPGA